MSDMIAVGHIAVSLMQNAPKENGQVGLDHPEQWPEDAQHFLAEATSATSARELSDVSRASVTATMYLTLIASTTLPTLRASKPQMDPRYGTRLCDATIQVVCLSLPVVLLAHCSRNATLHSCTYIVRF